MCTAISITVKDNYFGRNLDYEHEFGEKIVITPRNYVFTFKHKKEVGNHYAIIGMALPFDDYPLYFDATNEMGLSMAGLNFPDNAHYFDVKKNKYNVASFEFIPWILSQCKNVDEARSLIEKTNITNEEFNKEMKPSPLHWLIADKNSAITIEQTKEGMRVYDNQAGVLTNNPTFSIQSFNLNNYLSVSPGEPKNLFSDKINLKEYTRGMGGIGLPGDLSSMSRFVKASYLILNSDFGESEEEIVNQFFHILYSVYQIRGAVRVGDSYEITNYTSCCNTTKGIYYYTTYNSSRIRAVDINNEDLDGKELIVYNLDKKEKIFYQNMK